MTAPLEAVRAVVLRAGDGNDALADALSRAGADATTLVVSKIEDRSDGDLLAAVGDLGRFRWVAVTSRNAARRLALWSKSWPHGTEVAAVAAATADAVRAAGVRVDAVGPAGTGEDLAGCIEDGPVLVLAAAAARRELPEALIARGIAVHEVVAYETVALGLTDAARELVGRAEVLVAAAPSSLDAVVASGVSLVGRRVVALGPTTAARASSLGALVTVAEDRTAPAVVVAVAKALAR